MIKLLTSIGYGYLYTYNSELFPTEIRGFTISISLCLGRILTATSPFLIDLADDWEMHPMVWCGLTSLLLIPFLFVMPETKDVKKKI